MKQGRSSPNSPHHSLLVIYLGIALIIVTVLSLFIGRYPVPGIMNPFLLKTDPIARQIVLNSRLPRILGAILLGLVLGGAGASLQSIFSNPLIDAG
ncbi:MAG TPA: iron chelate uptake ABC transporter family permease subunit, partial [Rectinema sp.]|nr:iron chelate uptake ABC transporter family permease subunit [Rectinema sp.]